jgi:hypothetical protein
MTPAEIQQQTEENLVLKTPTQSSVSGAPRPGTPPPRVVSSTWQLLKELKVDKPRFAAGLLVVEPGSDSKSKPTVPRTTEDMFKLKDRELYVCRTDASESSNNRMHKSSLAKTSLLLKKLDPDSAPPTVYICNGTRRDEVYVPLILGEPGKEFGFYVQPWTATKSSQEVSNPFQFSGFHEFTTAVCLIGSGLEGVDQHGASFPLMKHYLPLFQAQKVQEIIYEPNAKNPYEQLALTELGKSIAIINKFSAKGVQKSLRIHLPWLDYVLFGIELFTRGKITYDALTHFTQIIIDKRADLIGKVLAIFTESSQIEVKFESPFDGLLLLSPEKYDAASLLQTLFSQLELSIEEANPATFTEEQQTENEKRLVQNCLRLLCSRTTLPQHHKEWATLAETTKVDELDKLESLFKLANAAMIAVSSIGRKNHQVCSFLPLSEKQIQIQYAKLSESLSASSRALPGVFMLTFIEPLNGYQATASSNECSMFYYPHLEHQTLSRALKKYQLLDRVFRNVFLFSQKRIVESSSEAPDQIADILSQSGSQRKPVF